MGRINFVLGLLFAAALCVSAQPKLSAVVNAGDYSTDLAPGALVSVFGTGFITDAAVAPGLPLPTTLGGTSLQVSDGSTTVFAPLYYVSANQMNGQLPYGLTGALTVTVTNGTGQSAPLSVKVAANAPKFFTLGQDGSGFVVATHVDNTLVSRTAPMKPGETIILYMNSLGAVTPAVAAGSAPGDGSAGAPLNKASDATKVLVDGLASPTVSYAGLAPGFPGLYQVNFVAPYDDKIGDSAISVTTGVGTTQSTVTTPVRSNGLYFVLLGSKKVNGQTFDGGSGANSALAFRHTSPQTFGQPGANAWTKTTGFSSNFVSTAGLAITLKNGNNIVFDNNGIEVGNEGTFYRVNPGYSTLFCMSNLTSPTNAANNLGGVYAGYFRLTASTTVDQMIGYFEGPEAPPPFDPANPFNTYHVNVFSNVTGTGLPKETASFVGDVFSSNTTPGTFSFSKTTVPIVASDGTEISTYRLIYTLKTPVTLPAGEYWFTHDVSTPATSVVPAATGVQTTNYSLRPTSGLRER